MIENEALLTIASIVVGLLIPVGLGIAAPSKWAALIWPIAAFVGMGVAAGILKGASPAVIAETMKPALLPVVVLGCIGHWLLR
jgi:hypothetical protein